MKRKNKKQLKFSQRRGDQEKMQIQKTSLEINSF